MDPDLLLLHTELTAQRSLCQHIREKEELYFRYRERIRSSRFACTWKKRHSAFETRMISTSRATTARRSLAVKNSVRNSGRSNHVARRPSSTLARSVKSPARAFAALKQNNLLFRGLPYSTEQILQSRDSKLDLKNNKVLYDATNEKDSCGVGLIANLKSKPSRYVVDVADEMLVRMSHRGGCGCDPNSGDGAGTFQDQ